MPVVGGLDIHRKQLTFDYVGTVSGEVMRGQIAPADREHLRAWLARFAGRDRRWAAARGVVGGASYRAGWRIWLRDGRGRAMARPLHPGR